MHDKNDITAPLFQRDQSEGAGRTYTTARPAESALWGTGRISGACFGGRGNPGESPRGAFSPDDRGCVWAWGRNRQD